MREVNRSLVLDVLREGGRMSRVDVARRTSLSKPTVSSIVEVLIREGAVLEVGVGHSQPRGGRPPALLLFNGGLSAYAGICLHDDAVQIAVADGVGRLLGDAVLQPGHAPDVVRAVHTLMQHADVDASRLRGCAIVAMPSDARVARMRDAVERRLGVAAVVVSSVAAATLAEGRCGAAAGRRSYMYLHAGRCVDAGIVVDGVLLRGAGDRAGDIAHLSVDEAGPPCACGSRGCLGVALRGATAHEAGVLLGGAVAAMVALLDPGMVVCGGSLVHDSHEVFARLRETVVQRAPRHQVTVVRAQLGAEAALLGGVQMAVEQDTRSYRIVGREAARRG